MSPLISATDLLALLDEPGLVLLDVRWRLVGPSTRAEYDAAHLPGAVFVDLDHDLAEPPDERGRHPLPSAAQVERVMRVAGVCSDSRVVCYDQADGTAAARAWWLLRYHGHDDVRLLDGGYAGWVAAGLPVTSEVPTPPGGDLVAEPGHLPVLDAIATAALARRGVVLDARARARYAGEQEPVDPVAGHIPGAVSAPTVENVDDDGRFLSTQRLVERFRALGVEPGTEVATYCGSGINAAHQVLALELAGIRAGLYADSWSGWISDPDRPVATGHEPG